MDDVVTDDLIFEIRSKGFSRIPIHLGENEEAVVGILLVKSLLGYKVPDKPITLKQMYLKNLCKIKDPYYCE